MGQEKALPFIRQQPFLSILKKFPEKSNTFLKK